MADNYHIDKNSKLFQKFLNLKSAKTNDPPPAHDRNQSFTQPEPERTNKNLQRQEPTHEEIDNEKPKVDHSVTFKKGMLHMSIDDVEEAASMDFAPAQYTFSAKDNYAEQLRLPNKYKTENVAVSQSPKQELEVSQIQIAEAPKPEKIERVRQRRTRDFQQRPKAREQKRPESKLVDQSEQTPNFPIRPSQPEFITKHQPVVIQKQNIQTNSFKQQTLQKREQAVAAPFGKEIDYKKKYEKLNQKLQELKQALQKQRKQRQKEAIQKQSEIQLIKEKYFELRSNEDTLTTDNKRLKEKLQMEAMLKTRFEEEVKELSLRIQEMEDMLEGKEGNLKKRGDEVGYWKGQHQILRGQTKSLSSQIERLQDRCEYLQSQNKMVKKDISNKENIIDELRRNINSLIDENNIVKDEIYKLTIKMYHYEQENQILKGDIMRRDTDVPQHISSINQSFRRTIENASPRKREERQRGERVERERPQRPERNDPDRGDRETTQTGQGNNRRREFARERAGTTKPERTQAREERRMHVEQTQRRSQPVGIPNLSQQSVQRIQFIEAQLQKRKDQKVLNGRQRREKIELERQLQQLLGK